MRVTLIPPAPFAIHTMSGVVGGFVPSVHGWSLLSATGVGIGAGIVLDMTCQVAWSVFMISRVMHQRRAGGENGGSEGVGLNISMGFAPLSCGIFAALTVLARFTYEKDSVPNPLADFADARSLRALERRVDTQQRAIEALQQEIATLQGQREV